MPSTYSTSLRLELIADGEQAGTWGATTNRNLGTLIEQAIAGKASIVLADANYTLTALSGASDESRAAILVVEGSATATRDVIVPAVSKAYVVTNGSSGSQNIRVKTSGGAAVTVPNGVTAHVYCDGIDTVLVSSNQTSSSGTVTSITASSPLTGGTITASGSIGMAASGVIPGTYGASTSVPVFVVDGYGRITAASEVSIGGGSGTGTVTQVNTGTGLTGGPITTSGTITLQTTGVSAGTYGSSSQVPILTVDAYGRVTGATYASLSAGTSISNTGGSVAATTTGVTITAGTVAMTNTGTFSVSGAQTIGGSLTVTGSGSFSGSSFNIAASLITLSSTVRLGNSNQTIKVGSDSGTSNRILLSTSGSDIRGLLWDGTNVSVGRGNPASSSNVLAFTGDTSAGTATFTVGVVYKTGGGTFSATSDERLKDIKSGYTLGLDAVLELEPIVFNYKDMKTKSYVGLSAQRVRASKLANMVFPGDDGYLRLDNSELVYTLVNAVKELNNKVIALENR